MKKSQKNFSRINRKLPGDPNHREAYAAYFRSVPKLVPALSPCVAASGHPFSLSAGLLGEGFFWGMALSVTVFAVSASLKWFYATLALAFAVYFACLPVIKKRQRPDA